MVSTDSTYDFQTIEEHDGILYAAGGDVWNRSNLATSLDGVSWSIDSLSNKSIFDLHSDGQDLYGVGTDGYILKGNPELRLIRTKHWGMLRGMTDSKIGLITVGGKDFNKGWIYTVTQDLQIDSIHTYEHELADVICDSNGNCIASGYGVILISNTDGYSWTRSGETGDFFISMDYNIDSIPFAVGYSGSILFSNDKGATWNKIKDGHSPLGRNQPFRSIKFYDKQGFIVGDNGTIWMSTDNGTTWSDASIKTDDDLFDFLLFNDQLILVSEKGRIYIVEL